MTKNALRQIPSIDKLLGSTEAKALIAQYGRESVVDAVRVVLEGLRAEIISRKSSSFPEERLLEENILTETGQHLRKKFTPSLARAVNATGVILHTGLGRAELSEDARSAIQKVAEGYCTLAVDLKTGQRGHRDAHLKELLCTLTGAEDATMVNNNAAATMLILNTLAKSREVIVSRGQLVEIGGSFRMPEVMEASGAVLREVGTTNKTHLKDYEAAISEESGAVMRVHHSNYRIVGFAEEPSIEDLAELCRKHSLPLIDDLGSGALVDLREFGLETEPLVQRSIRAGVDVACFSGDKLIGGPQAGIIVGKASVIQKIRKNHLSRALRVGKLTIAGMEATLRLFLNREHLREAHPVYRMFSLSLEEVEKRAQKVARQLRSQLRDRVEVSVIDGGSQVGSGSVPVETIPTRLLRIKHAALSAEEISRRLRSLQPPVFTRVHRETVMLDFRTILGEEDKLVLRALLDVLMEGESQP